MVFDILDDLPGIGAVANDHHSAHGVDAALVEHASPKFRTELNRCDVADCDGCAIRIREQDVFDITE